jgi:GntR family transcriptional repressor for pyruvate dehydrogenase complex
MFLPVGAIVGRLDARANDLHEAILDAIEAKDPELAAGRMSEHIANTRRIIEDWLRR